MYDLTLLKGTNFGNNDRVWNIPSPSHNFGQYTQKTFTNVIKRMPLLATSFILSGDYTDDLKEYDYLIIKDLDTNKMRYYFVDGVTGDRNIIMLSVILDTFTTYNLLSTPITGTLVRKHDTNVNESPFDYPTALVYNPMYENYRSDVVSYFEAGNKSVYNFIESSIDLVGIPSAKTIQSDLQKNVTIPSLKKPSHKTLYSIYLTNEGEVKMTDDWTGALTLYLSNKVPQSNLDTLRGLAGDGAISDSFQLPQNSVTITEGASGDVRLIDGKLVERPTDLYYKIEGFTPKNKAIEGCFKVEISSLASGDAKVFPSWTLRNSLNVQNQLVVKLWNDPKPSGNPFCSPLNPPINTPIKNIPSSPQLLESIFEILLKTSVKGEQWLKNPLIYNTGKGEIFANVESQLQREKSAFERDSAMANLEISQREKDIRIAQQKYNYEASQTMGILGIAGDILSGDIGGAISGASNVFMDKANQRYIKELQALKSYEGSKQSQLIKIAHSNNLRSLDIQDKIRKVVAPEIVYREHSSLKGYDFGNDFRVSIVQPDIETLRLKDMEYSLYGYPVAENVENYNMLTHLRTNHSVFMFSDCIINVGGDIGDITREFLRNGIRILSNKYSISNLINNPKK